MKVERISYEDCKEWLLYKHYAKRLCSISFAFGLYIDNVLQGVCTFGMPASSTLATSICGKDFKKYVLELNRLVVNEGLRKNTLSFFVSKSINKLPNNKIIVSFADANQSHTGYIYQATNFLYTGLSSNTTKLIDKSGNEFHFRNIGHYQKNNRLNVSLIKKRKNEHLINKKEVASYLRSYKNNYTNAELETKINVPKSTIEHWFRLDSGFSFPSIENWQKLKRVLKFDNTYDKVMLDFEMIPDGQEIVKKLDLKKIDILAKHRYIYFKGSKSFKRLCRKNLKYHLKEYPKNKNIRYNTNYVITPQLRLL